MADTPIGLVYLQSSPMEQPLQQGVDAMKITAWAKRTLSMALVLLVAITGMTNGVLAAEQGDASIGFSSGGIYYMPYGISGVAANLDLDFGIHAIRDDIPVQHYGSLNKGGYVVNNESGGTSGYVVSLGLSSFDNGLEGVALTLTPDEQGIVSGNSGAKSPPIFMNGQGSVILEADGLSPVTVLEGKRYSEDPSHTALGRWGFNFLGELQVYSHTVLAGRSKAVMTWDIIVADF